jgi:hypothetical protein
MTDLTFLLETILLLAVPFVPVAIGVMLRKKFPAAPETPPTGAQKAGRLAGNILFWGGLAGLLFVLILFLHFKGKLF